jgi:hypothetical protein
MPATIQTIQKPTKARALDTSTSEQIVGPQMLEDPSFDVDVAEPSGDGVTVTGPHWMINDADIEITGGKAVWTAYSGTNNRRLQDNSTGPFTDVTARWRVKIVVSDYTSGELRFVTGSYSTGYTINSAKTWIFDMSPETGGGNFHIDASNNDGDGTEDAVMSVSEVSVYKLESFSNNNHGQIYSGRALEFDGVSDYLDLGIPFSETNHAICVWAKVVADTADKHIFDGRDANNDGIMLKFAPDETIAYLLNDHPSDGADIVTTIAGQFTNTWVRIVATYDGTTQSLYLNGVLFDSNTTSTTVSVTTNARIGGKNFASGNLFNGMLSDFQAWNTHFTADDALYDYNNPEQLALNRGGTSLTNSNLKIWYPMNDGHRGQQSYILDASNTGLGDELLTNGDMSSATGWTLGSGWSISGGIATFDGSGGVSLYRSFSASTGDTFKITYDITSYTSGGFRIVYDGTNGTTNSAVGSYTEYVSYKGGNTNLFLQSVSTSELSIDNVSVKPVNKKNHATTVFMGEDLWDVADGATAPWSQNSGTSTHTADSAGSVKITPGKGGSGGSYTYLQDDKGLKEDLEVGRTYRLTCDMATDVEEHAITPSVRAGGINYDGTAITATNLIDNPGFETAGGIWANWTENAGSGALANETSIVHNGDDSAKLTSGSGGERSYIAQSFTTVVGTKYLVTAWLRGDGSSGSSVRYTVEEDSVSGTDIVAETDPDVDGTTWTQIAFQFTAGTTTSVLTFLSSSGSSLSGYVDDVVVTAFISPSIDWVCADNSDGDYFFPRNMLDTEMITASNDSDFTTPSSNWVHFGTFANAPVYTGGAITFLTTNSHSGAQGIKLGTSSFAALNVGRNYILSLKAGVNTILGSPAIKVRVGDSNIEDQALSTDASTEYTFLLTPTNTTGELKIYHESSSIYTFTIDDIELHPEENVWVDEMVVKEIGLASGWTEADQQLDIPQTALQSYNQLAWFPGQEGSDATLDSQIDTLATAWSFSFWLFNKDNHSFDFIIGSTSNRNLAVDNTSNRKLYYRDGDNQYNALSDEVIPQGEWVHIVVTAIADTSITAYINGEAQTTSTTMAYSGSDPDTQLIVNRFMEGYSAGNYESLGCITEISYFANTTLNQAQVNTLYNDGKAYDVEEDTTLWSACTSYWRNNGLTEWQDRKGSNDLNTNGVTETMLITAGVDGSRDSQGFIMNRQRATNSLNSVSSVEDGVAVHDGYVEVGGSVQNSDVFSISCWIKSAYLGQQQNIIDNREDSTHGWFLYISTGNEPSLKIHDGSDTVTIQSGTAITVDTWHHIVVTYAGGAGALKMYVDGKYKHTITATDVGSMASAITSKTPLIGVKGFGTSDNINGFNGQIDDVLLYTKVLSDGGIADEADAKGEIARIYNAGKRSHK